MNIRLDQVFSEISGVSSLAIIRSIVAEERDPKVLARHRDVRCKKAENEVVKALEGNFRQEHLFSLKQALNAYDFIHTQLAECDLEIKKFFENRNISNKDIQNDKKQNDKLSKPKKRNKKNSYHYESVEIIQAICFMVGTLSW